MSKHYQVILNDADSTAEFLQFIGEDAGWRECVVIDKFWTTTYNLYESNSFNMDAYYVGIIHLLTIDDVAIPGASIFEPYEDGNNGEYYAQTRPLLAFIRADGKQAFIPAKYDHPPFYDID